MRRTISAVSGADIRIVGGNRAAHYAGVWLELLGGSGFREPGNAPVVISGDDVVGADCLIRTWDYQVGMEGDGVLASASSGAATVIGHADGPAVPLPADMPEKWCGAFAAILALAETWRQRRGRTPHLRYDISSADILRSFSLQNSGGPAEMAHSWRRNGRLCIEHGGIFPMGFYACKDGHVAILGRSRRDWRQIREAIGDPEWAQAEEFADPFKLARDGEAADALLEQTLQSFTRDELLARGLKFGAVIAPVFNQAEAEQRRVFARPSSSMDGQPCRLFRPSMPVDRRCGARNPALAFLPIRLWLASACWNWPGSGLGRWSDNSSPIWGRR